MKSQINFDSEFYDLIKTDDFENEARRLISSTRLDEAIFKISSANLIREKIKQLGNLHDFMFSFLDEGLIRNTLTGEYFKVDFKTNDTQNANIEINIFGTSKENNLNIKSSWAGIDVTLTPIKSKNPKIYVREKSNVTFAARYFGVPIHMSKESKKFKSRPFIWANDLIETIDTLKEIKSRI